MRPAIVLTFFLLGPQLVAQAADSLPRGAVHCLGDYRFWHGDTITAVAFSPDGKMLATGGGRRSRSTGTRITSHSSPERGICLWDTATGKEIRRLDAIDAVYALCFSPDGKTLASGCGNIVKLWEAATGTLGQSLKDHERTITTLAYSPDGRWLHSVAARETRFAAAQTDNTEVRRWEIASGELLKTWKDTIKSKLPAAPKGEYQASLSITPDGKRLIKGFWKEPPPAKKRDETLLPESLKIHDAESGKQLGQVEGLFAETQFLVFSADGKRFAAPGTKIYVGNIGGGKPVMIDEPATTLALSADGKRLASWLVGGHVRVWDAETGKKLRDFGRPHGVTWDRPLVFSADGRNLAMGDGENVRLWDLGNGRERSARPGHYAGVNHVGFSRDGQTVVSGCDACFWRWQVPTGKPLGRLVKDDLEKFGHVVVATGDHVYAIHSDDDRVWLHEGFGHRKLETLKRREYFTWASVSSDGQVLVLRGRKAPHLDLYDSGSGKSIGFTRQPTLGDTPAVSPDRKHVAWWGEKSIFLGDFAGKIVRELGPIYEKEPAGTPWVWSRILLFSPDGRYLFSSFSPEFEGKKHCAICLWDVATGTEIRRFAVYLPDGKTADVACAAFSPDGGTLAFGRFDGGGVSLWEVASGQERRKLDGGHKEAVLSVAFAADGRMLASGSADQTVLLWDLAAKPNQIVDPQTLWADLAGRDGRRAYDAINLLIATPKATVPFLKARVQPVGKATQDAINNLVDHLGNAKISVRDKATHALEDLGEIAVPALTKALARKPSVAMRQRVEEILTHAHVQRRTPSGELLRTLRALEILQRIGTKDAIAVLRALAEGALDAWLTQEAKVVVRRLAK